MSPNISYAFDILLVIMGLFFIVYVMYGRTKNRSLIGGYKPGTPGYDAFRKLIGNRNLMISVVLTLLFLVNAFIDARRVLDWSSSHSVLVGAPIMVLVGLIIILLILPVLFGKKR